MNNNIPISEDMAPEVLDLASRLYSEQQNSYSTAELMEAASEAQIPPELVQQAIQQIQIQRQQKQQKKQKFQKFVKQLLIIFGGIFAIILLWSGITYNSLSNAANQVDAAWAQVENQFQRRADLIPNLVNVSKAYAKQEQELVTLLIQSREAYLQANNPTEKATAIVAIKAAIDTFQNIAIANPQLQSSQLFINLQYEIAGTENRLATERRRYNKAVQKYNQKVSSFPNFLIANNFGFEKKDFFQAETTSVPKVAL
ncbi:MAG: LemA family protein [Moorea sp. SIO2B7]|nr:LemA family protein [Moorena sp. SIO2B7]